MLIPGKSHRGKLPVLTETEHASSDRLRHDVVHLAETIGERNTNYLAGLVKTGEYITSRFTAFGYDIRLEPYLADGMTVSNIEATLTGHTKPNEIIVIGAHYDSAPGTPGAADNASAVAVLLELARHFKDCSLKRTIRFVAFVNEEPPYFQTDLMGSYVYARGCRQRNEGISAMLCLESVGYFSSAKGSQHYPPPLDQLYPDTANFIAFCGNFASYPLLRRCIKHFRASTQFPSEGLVAPESFAFISFSDHWAFWQMGYPAIMITDTAFLRNPHYHLSSDLPENLDFDCMARVAEGIKIVVDRLTNHYQVI